MDIARLNSIQVLMAGDAQLSANAALRLTKGDAFYPELFVGSRWSRVNGVVQGSNGGLLNDVDKRNANLGASIRMSIDIAGMTYGVDAAQANASAAKWNWIEAELAAETAAAILYYDLLEDQAKVEIAAAAQESARAFHEIAEARYQAGASLETDVLRAFAHLSEVRQGYVESRAALATSSTRIAELLGLDPIATLEPSDALEVHKLVTDIEEVSVDAHPAIEASRARLASAKAGLAENRAGLFAPELLLDAGYNDFGQGYRALSQQESLSASLSWDLSPSLFAKSDLLTAELLKAEHGAEAAHRRVSAELVRAQIATLSADDLLETTHRRVEAAKSAVALESIRHEAGDALLIELLDAEVSLRRAETAKAAAICNHNRAQHLLRQALGR
jgi:outer membrane protein TolC